MSFLQVTRYEVARYAPERPNILTAWMEAITDPQMVTSVVLANIRLIRGCVPYVYVLYFAREIGDEVDDDPESRAYISQLRTHTLSYVVDNKPFDMTVFEVGYGDILPFLMSLDLNTCGLLLLPEQSAWEKIADSVTQDSSVDFLLREGGAYLTNTDSVCFRLRTFDERLTAFFIE